MKILGIIAEYNPMHNGHIYLIQKAKELVNPDYTIVLMSGSFTQQGNLSMFSKLDKASIAIENGVDMVLELPTIYATASSENFAYNSVKTLNELGNITHIAFGAECANKAILEQIAHIEIDNKTDIILQTKNNEKYNQTIAKTHADILKKYLDNNITDILNKPNNILAIEYLKTLILINSNIEPVMIQRNNEYISSTNIRNVLDKNTYNNLKYDDNKLLKSSVPNNVYSYIYNNKFNNTQKLWSILRFQILMYGKAGLKNILDVTEGLENRLYDLLNKSNSYEEYIFNVKSKRYTLGRIKRICVYIILGITKEKYNMLCGSYYVRVLKVAKNSKKLLSIISKSSNIPVITSIKEKNISKLPYNIQESIKLDIFANNIAYPNSNEYTENILN